jgi:hypothetical protein
MSVTIPERIKEISRACHCPDCFSLWCDEAVDLLRQIDATYDPEVAHLHADRLLLALIGDDRITAAFQARWYA